MRRKPDLFEFPNLDASSLAALAELRERFQQLAKQIEGIGLGPTRPISLAMTKLEESYMWTVRAISHAQREEHGE